METGTLCLILDSIMQDLRFVNKQVLLLQHYVDCEEPVPDLEGFTNTLNNTKRTLYELLDCAKNNKSVKKLEHLISCKTRNELEYMLSNYVHSCVNDEKPDFDYVFIKTCAYLAKNVRYLKLKYYGDYLKNNKNDHVKTFMHIVDIFVRYDDACYRHMLDTIRKMIALSEKIDVRLSTFKSNLNDGLVD